MAAPGPACALADPMIAPVAAPSALPTKTFAPAASFAALAGSEGPNVFCATCRHEASSVWNGSHYFDVPGSAIKPGPVGAVTQPDRTTTPTPATSKPALIE